MPHTQSHSVGADSASKLAGIYFDYIANYVYSSVWTSSPQFKELVITIIYHGVVEAVTKFFEYFPEGLQGPVVQDSIDSDIIDVCDGSIHPYLSPVNGWSGEDLRQGDIASIVQIIMANMDLARDVYRMKNK